MGKREHPRGQLMSFQEMLEMNTESRMLAARMIPYMHGIDSQEGEELAHIHEQCDQLIVSADEGSLLGQRYHLS